MKSMVQGFEDAGKKLGVKQVIIGNSSNDQAKENRTHQHLYVPGCERYRHRPIKPHRFHGRFETGQ